MMVIRMIVNDGNLSVINSMNFALQNAMPAMIGIIHNLYRREKPAKLKRVFPRAANDVSKGKNIIIIHHSSFIIIIDSHHGC